jgi:hypothetical protein
MDLLIERLGYAFDVTSNLDHAPGEDGWYAMNAINETRDGLPSDSGKTSGR